ncbi:MAG: hypothetical protein ACRYFX_20835 [Janthinobacterium lividum]
MRAICETCNAVQPPDWQPGDLCGHCGNVVRREKRCHWCVKLTPDGKYCRHCGAGLVPDAQYGAARWLKHVGSDQFVIPDRLAAMDPEQVEHFTRLYQRHAIVAERHVDDLAFAEGFARQRGWARALEEELLPRLPLPDDELAAFTLPPLHGTTDAEKLLEIRETSPYKTTRVLASLARLRLWQGTDATVQEAGVYRDFHDAHDYLSSPDQALKTEAGLTLCHWRMLLENVSYSTEWQLKGAVLAALNGPLQVEAQTAVALFDACNQPEPQPVPAEALGSPDPDVAFAAALASHAPDALHAALRVPRRRYAAARILTTMGADFDLAALLPGFTPEQIGKLLWPISKQQRPRPDLRPLLQQIIAGQQPISSSDIAPVEELLLLDLHPGDAERLVSQYPEPRFLAKLLQVPTLPPAEVAAVCRELLRLGLFDTGKLTGLLALIQADGLPLTFVPETIGTVTLENLSSLQQVVYHQLNTHAGPDLQPLHTLLRRLRWDVSLPVKVRNWAHEPLEYWYAGSADSHRPELTFTEEAATAYFPTFRAFIEEFLYGLEHPAELATLATGFRFARPLGAVRELDDSALANTPLATLPPALLGRFSAALLAFVNDDQNDNYHREGGLHLLNLMRFHQPWQAEAQARFETLLGGYYGSRVQKSLAVPADHAVIPFDPADGGWTHDSLVPDPATAADYNYWTFAGAQPAPLSLYEKEEVEEALALRIGFLNADYEKEHERHPEVPFDRESVLIDLPRYARQYVPFTTANGRKLVWVQLLRHPPADWRTHLLRVLDGGNHAIQAVCRIDTGQVLALSINGPA